MIHEGTDGRDRLHADGAGDVAYGHGGDDTLDSSAPGTVLAGGAGDDTYRLYNADSTLIETAEGGIDTVRVWASFALPDHVENLVSGRVTGWHALQGNALDNAITAGGGTQDLAGHGGDDTLTGGGGADRFHVGPEGGHDTVTDFEAGLDRLVLWNTGIASFDALMAGAERAGDGTVLHLGEGASVTLRGVLPADLSAADVALTGPSGPPAGAVLAFADEFDVSPTDPGGAWNTLPADSHPVFSAIPRGSRYQTYVETVELPGGGHWSPFSVEDGVLRIAAIRAPEGVEAPAPWLSGALDTHGAFSQTYGHFEIRARLPEGQALWPAFWLMRDDYAWPPEIDLFDILGDATDVLHVAVHAALWGDKVTAGTEWLVPDMAAGFHVYGTTWTPEAVTFLFDGVEIFSVATPPDMHAPMAMRLNLAVGGWHGGPDATTPDGAALEVDWVRAWSLPGAEALPRADDLSAFADIETGLLHTSITGRRALWDDDLRRVEDGRDLALEEGTTATLLGDGGANRLTGNAAGTVLDGGGGDDTILGGGGHDYIVGGDGDDVIEGGAGADTLVGGAGDDTYILRRGDGSARPNGDLILEDPDGGFDTIIFADLLPTDIRTHIDWARWRIVAEGPDGAEHFAVRVVPGIGGHDLASSIERVVFADGTVWDLAAGLILSDDDGGNPNAGSAADDLMLGHGGNDTMAGMDGDDTLDGGAGVDALHGWNGDDLLRDSGVQGGDSLHGEAGNDTLLGGGGLDFLWGGDGDDSLRASRDGDVLDGGAGNDILRGGNADDTLSGGDGRDNLRGQGGHDILSGGHGDDVVSGDAGDDRLSGGAGRDILRGGAGNDTLDGGAGGDRLSGGGGSDVFVFDLSQIARDVITDFAAGERIEIRGVPAGAHVSVEGGRIDVTDPSDGLVRTLFAQGAEAADVWLLPA